MEKKVNTIKKNKKIVLVLLSFLVIFTFMVSPMSVQARGQSGAAYNELIQTLISGTYTSSKTSTNYEFSQNNYKMSDGGYAVWYTIWNQDATVTSNTGSGSNSLLSSTYEALTAGAKQQFLEDAFTLANAMADDTAYKAKNGMVTGDTEVTDETVSDFLTAMQNCSGMGSTLLASILQNTKPDFVTANRWYKPFSGPVSSVIGFFCILIVALLGLSMALDIFYITIPFVQLALDSENSDDKAAKGLSRLVSSAARSAVKTQVDSGGSGGQSGSNNKSALATYAKNRWKEMLLLGVCLLYLVSGNIYSLVSQFINLMSGFLGA